ncbi:hypothetical protein PSOLE_12530 [Pseudomonas oleovorans subsp. oleovorans]|uniref:Uncharacterized protein n=1 Tax=Ectopseudomonas oleovorans TaxID=301 RepID=A0A379JYM0_ECTOL|nr:hypothetical protein PSOLE_12530 [Pseudomonas oleovorans subsp. oleovorans]SEJ32488.1 hypothetical protein SAMN05216280_101861 [Pseudomonas oleovorans]SUD53658.1 Uncharacterised protein [Pseudomonas oleovorans]
MSLPFWCVFISALLIFIAKAPVARAMAEEGPGAVVVMTTITRVPSRRV